MNFPAELKYSKSHEWVRMDGEIAVVGISDFAQDALGDVVFINLPTEGDAVTAGESFGDVESVKAVSDIISPVSGTICAVNEALADAPETLNSDPYGAWRALEKLYKDGVIRAIGASNFYPDRLADMVAFNEIAPMVDQVETNPLNQQIEARKNMVKRGVAQEAWAPFGEGMQNMFSNPTLAKIGEVHGKSVAQVILRWLTQRDIVALPKSTHKERMEENLNIFDFRLSDSEMTTIAGLDTKTSMFFRHDTPEAVDRFVSYVKERAGRE